MRSSRVSLFVVGALAYAGALDLGACSGGTLTSDAGTGTGGASGAGGGGSVSCDHAPAITSCTPNPGTLPDPADQSSRCTVEGAQCKGSHCFDFGEMPFVTTCCGGFWWPGFEGPCPGPFHPGDPFACTADATGPSCAIGQTYCSSSNADRTDSYVSSCQPVCAAGDCTCFCGDAGHCDFKPAGSACAGDICHCWSVTTPVTGGSVVVPGAVQVDCTYVVPNSGECYQVLEPDARCAGYNYELACANPTEPPPFNCTAMPGDAASTASCGGEITYYCCFV